MARRKTITLMKVGSHSNDWGDHLNNNLNILDERLRAQEEKSDEPGFVAAAVIVGSVAVESNKPVSRKGLFNFLRRKDANG